MLTFSIAIFIHLLNSCPVRARLAKPKLVQKSPTPTMPRAENGMPALPARQRTILVRSSTKTMPFRQYTTLMDVKYPSPGAPPHLVLSPSATTMESQGNSIKSSYITKIIRNAFSGKIGKGHIHQDGAMPENFTKGKGRKS